ncbi:DNA polymerase III subunit beta [Roseovarius sp. SYSU LYC5161]|uniref:DNA polymerase III subunit beta n=1 Tax=Roseovarius halophilus (ex Wu et al. 2025) TaxID=3376060 RepID=UPI003999FD8F
MPNDMTHSEYATALQAIVDEGAAALTSTPAPLEPAAVEIDHGRALTALGHLVKVLDKKTPAPVLRGVLIRHDGSDLRVTATDMDLRGDAYFSTGTGGAPWAAVVDAAALHKVLMKTKGKAPAVRLEPVADAGETGVVVTIGKTRVTLGSVAPVSDFPTAGPLNDDRAFALGASIVSRPALADLFTRPAFAISNEETRYYLNGLYLHLPGACGRNGAESTDTDGRYTLRAVATDGHRLARFDSEIRLPGMTGRETVRHLPDGRRVRSLRDDAGQIVPRKAVQIIGKLLTARGAPDLAGLEFTPSACRVSVDCVSIAAKAVDGAFPDYTRVTPAGDAHFALDRADLAGALPAVQIVHDSGAKAVKMTIGAAGGTVTATGTTGTAEQAFGAEIIADGGDHATGFNADYLANVLASFKAADRVYMTQAGAGDPARFEAPGDALAVVVMPMRV